MPTSIQSGQAFSLGALDATVRSHCPVNGSDFWSAFWAGAGITAAAASRQTRLSGFMSALVYRNRGPNSPLFCFYFGPNRDHGIRIRGMVDHPQVLLLDEVLVEGVIQNV